MISIVQVVVVPIVLGIVINKLFGDFVRRAIKLLPLISVIAIVLIVGGVVSVSSQQIMQTGLFDYGCGNAAQSAWLCFGLCCS